MNRMDACQMTRVVRTSSTMRTSYERLRRQATMAVLRIATGLVRRNHCQLAMRLARVAFRALRANGVLWAALGESALRRGELTFAIDAFSSAVASCPESALLHFKLGKAYMNCELFDAATEHLERALMLDTSKWKARLVIAEIKARQRSVDVARRYCEIVVGSTDRGPRAQALCQLASLAEEKGDRQQAEELLRAAIECAPGTAWAFLRLVQGGYLSPDSDSSIAEYMERRLQDGEGTEIERECLCFALGQCYDARGEYDVAFKWFRHGNVLARRRMGEFDVKRFWRSIDERVAVYSRSFIERMQMRSLSSDFLVAVVGMPRSGTTLVEQILSSHSRVNGGGERQDIQRLVHSFPSFVRVPGSYPTLLRRVESGRLQRLSTETIAVLRRAKGGAERLVTKTPNDVFDVGLIAILLTGARLIHIRRNPMDTCLSCYMQHFEVVQYATDLEWLAEVYRGYQRIMEHWMSVLPEHLIKDLEYESLIREPQLYIPQVIAAGGLSYEEQCQRFFENHRRIDTPSRWQVRQPLYATSVGRWRHYEEHLGPLLGLGNSTGR